jgi:hypothetical protein
MTIRRRNERNRKGMLEKGNKEIRDSRGRVEGRTREREIL